MQNQEELESLEPPLNQLQEPEKNKKENEPKEWRHPQSWVPWEISFYFFIAPFIFWPVVIVWFILNVYSQNVADIPLEKLKEVELPTITYVYADDGTPIAEFYKEHRLVLPLEKIPPKVIEAFLAAEDSSFYQHQGVDFIGLVRAALANFQAGHTVQGASTITQQMIRTFLLTSERTYDRKLREMVLAWKAENLLSKDDILYLYLNRIYLGRGAYGVESAARLYYGKTVTELNIAEAAMLAGLVKAPGTLGAHLNSARSRERQHYVIQRMMESGYISPAEAQTALNTPLNFITQRPNLYREMAPQFSEQVRRQLINYFKDENIVLEAGLHVQTTINLQAQKWAMDALREGLDALAHRQRMSPKIASLTQDQALGTLHAQRERLVDRPLLADQESEALVTDVITAGQPGLMVAVGNEKGFVAAETLKWLVAPTQLASRFKVNDLIMVRAVSYDSENNLWTFLPAPPPDLQGALVLIENKTGAIKAIVGGRDFDQSHFNRAVQARRQPGSSFKPFVYAAAIDNGYTEASVVYDVPTSYPQGGGKTWQPKNYSGKHSGPMTVYSALVRSNNVIAVKVCEAVGPETVIDYARRMGVTSPLTNTLSLALGASEVTLMELTTAYSTFPNQGSWAWPIFMTKVEDRHGRVAAEFKPHLTEAISPQTAFIMVHMLRGVVTSGTAARVGAALKVPLGGKTGTTNSQADALFVGFTADYTCGVWVGRDRRVTLGGGEQGGRSAAPIFVSFMSKFLEGKESPDFIMPDGLVRQGSVTSEATGQTLANAGGFIFKVGEVGAGRIDEKAMGDIEAARLNRPPDLGSLSQEELDRRLSDYLSDYANRHGQ